MDIEEREWPGPSLWIVTAQFTITDATDEAMKETAWAILQAIESKDGWPTHVTVVSADGTYREIFVAEDQDRN